MVVANSGPLIALDLRKTGDSRSGEDHADCPADLANTAVGGVDAGARICGRENDLRIGPADARACEGRAVALDERACLSGRWTGKAGKSQQVLGHGLGQPRTQEQFAHHDVTSVDALVQQEFLEDGILRPKVSDPGVGVDQNHVRFQAERLARRAFRAVPPKRARRPAAFRASRARNPCSTKAVLVAPG